jgi:hypothetical protein
LGKELCCCLFTLSGKEEGRVPGGRGRN